MYNLPKDLRIPRAQKKASVELVSSALYRAQQALTCQLVERSFPAPVYRWTLPIPTRSFELAGGT